MIQIMKPQFTITKADKRIQRLHDSAMIAACRDNFPEAFRCAEKMVQIVKHELFELGKEIKGCECSARFEP